MKWYEAPLVPRTWIAATNSNSGTRYLRTPSEYDAGKGYYSDRRVALNEPPNEPPIAAIKALDPETGDVKWQYSLSRYIGFWGPRDGGWRGVRRDP